MSLPDPNQGVVITLKDLWVELGRTRDEMARMRDDMIRMSVSPTALADHETRIRSNEKWRYALPPTIFLSMASVGVTVTGLVMHR